MVESQISSANGDLGWKFCPEIRSSVNAPVSPTLHSFFHSPCQATQHVAVRKERKTFTILGLRSWQQNTKTFPNNKFLRNYQKNLTKLPGQSRCHRHYSEKEKGRDLELPVPTMLEISWRKTKVHPQNKEQRVHQAVNRDLDHINIWIDFAEIMLAKLCANVLHYEINCHMIVSSVPWMDEPRA
jgi:hypothetical protein